MYFYPKAMAPGCAAQAGESRDAKEKLSRQKLVILGFGPDLVKKLKKVSEERKLKFDLLFYEDHAIAKKHGVWGLKKIMDRKYTMINRMVFLVGIDGKIKQMM